MRAPLCGLPVALSVKVIVPGRSTPTGERTLVNLTITVQLAPGARFTPVQLSVCLAKNQAAKPEPVPDVTVTLETDTEEPPAGVVFVSVTVPFPAPRLPIGVLTVIVKGFGEIP